MKNVRYRLTVDLFYSIRINLDKNDHAENSNAENVNAKKGDIEKRT